MSPVSDQLKVSFQLTAHDDRLEVRAIAKGGECREETGLPPATLDQWVDHDPTQIPASALLPAGQTLYRCLMGGDALNLTADVLLEARRGQQPAHFELRFDADQTLLAQHPWEMLADEDGRFLVRDGLVDITRYITYPQPPPTLDATWDDSSLLRVTAQPQTLPPLAIADLALHRLEILRPATFLAFETKLLIERMDLWGLHFDGHGGLLLQCPDCRALHPLSTPVCICGTTLAGAPRVGALAFEKNGNVDWRTTAELASALYNTPLRLAVLLACETARVGDDLLFSGLAPGLILAGVPAVVGMQYPVSDHFAGSFANRFYTALLAQQDVLDAFHTARQMSSQEAWYSPVLYLRYGPTLEEPLAPVYHTRKIDTAVPAEAQAGAYFLVRLWIRRPETEPLTEAALRDELAVPEHIAVRTREAQADVEFEPVGVDPDQQRTLRRGEVDVELGSPICEIIPESMRLFVDEHLDAPPAIFTVRSQRIGPVPLLFRVWQDGGQIAAITHVVQILEEQVEPQSRVETGSLSVPVKDHTVQVAPPEETPPKVPEPELSPEVDEDLAKRLEQLYLAGLVAFWLEQWDRAVRELQAVVDERPDYKDGDAAAKLEEARRRGRLGGRYAQAQAAWATEDWPAMLSALEQLVAEAPDYTDAAALLEMAKRRKRLASLYSQAKQLQQAGQWQAVLKVIAQIAALDPNYPDPEGLASTAQWKVAEQKRQAELEERQAELEDLYGRALLALNSGRWLSAQQLLVQLQGIEPGYRDVEPLLNRTEAELERERKQQEQSKTAIPMPEPPPAAERQGCSALLRLFGSTLLLGVLVVLVLLFGRDQ